MTTRDEQIDGLLKADGADWRTETGGSQLVRSDGPAQLQPKQRRKGLVLLAAAVGVVVIAIGGALLYAGRNALPTFDAPFAGTSDSASADPLDPSVPKDLAASGRKPVPADVIPTSQAPQNAIHMPWKLAAISTDGRALTIYFASGDGDCVNPVGMVVDQSSNAVTLDPLSVVRSGSIWCPSMLRVGYATVTLTEPLGQRPLLHPVADKDWSASLDTFR